MNIKQDFLKWLLKRDTYKDLPETSKIRFIEEYVEFLGFDPFEVNDDFSNIEEIKEKISTISEELKNTNPEYVDFQKRGSNGAPAAFLGKKNYSVFLDEIKNGKSAKELDLGAILKQPHIQSIINEPEFYFQKGQDALKKWMDLSVSDDLKNKLIGLSKDYNRFLDEAKGDSELKQILDLLFEVISYCDNHARDKNILNQYEDKRALADAFVRMNSWVEKLIHFKFLPEKVGPGSTQNAFNFLLDPERNSTVLSENHRKQISENIIRIPYNPIEFNTDLKSFFASYNLKTVNPQNYSHLLMHIIYSFQDYWRKEEKGPLSARFLNVIEKVKNAIDEDPATKGLFVFEKPSRDFVWIKDAFGIIGNLICHYEISVNKTPSLYTVDVHFEGKELSEYQKFNPILNSLPIELIRFPWRKKGDSIRFGNGIPIDHPDLVNELKDQLVYIEENIGDRLRNVIKGVRSEHNHHKMTNKTGLNQILFGPPGTGKTFNTINKALEIIGENLDGMQRKDVKILFENKVQDGQIVFTTFHQSMSYEDFIEGIKPLKPDPEQKDESVKYDVIPGIFKTICNRAKTIKHDTVTIDWNKPKYFKMSLGGKNKPNIHEWCIENKVIALGWGGDFDLSEYQKFTNWNEFRDNYSKDHPKEVEESRFNIQAAYSFLKMNKGDIVVVSKGNQIIDAIGIIKGLYYWDDKNPIDYFHFREVEWLATNMNTPPDRFVRKQISQMTIYEFYNVDIIKEAFEEITNPGKNNTEKRFVFIIDEINRGNVSQIFGELITLIEEDKRLGKDEALEVTLPYSKEKFGVPANLYIIGTMNTADRSVEALDTALRRRFCFEEMPPKYDLPELQYEFEGIKISNILRTLNKRIEKLLDKDHQIGHSYFMIKTGEDVEQKLITSFYKNIIPLLQEYFFGDFGKVGLVLGKGFVKINEWNKNSDSFADFDYQSSTEFSEREVFEIIDYRKNNINYSIKTKEKEVILDFQKAIKLLMKQEIE